MIEIDGSKGEGGGQTIRTALALSTLLQKPFKITGIRHNRPKPGLKAQHLHGITSLQKLCNARCKGAELGSTELTYYPLEFKGKNVSIDIGTAGSITLLLQTVLLPCLFSNKPIVLKIKGGTDTSWAPPIDYLSHVVLPQLQRCGQVQLNLLKRGYYPAGGGEVEVKIKPNMHFNPLQSSVEHIKKETTGYDLVQQHNLIHIRGVSHASHELEKSQVAERQAMAAKSVLSKLECPTNISKEYVKTESIGSGITLWARFSLEKEEIDITHPIVLGSDILGKKGVPADDIGQQAGKNLLKDIESSAPVDPVLADHLIPFLGLVGGSIRTSTITDHTKTNIEITEQFLGKIFSIDKEKKIISV